MQGPEMKAQRKAAKMSQAQLAEALGMARETIGAMERGTAPIERRTERLVMFVTSMANSNTMYAMALKCEQASRGECTLDPDEFEQIAEWLKQAAPLPRDWVAEKAESGA